MDPTKRITSEQAMQDPYFLEDPLPTSEYVESPFKQQLTLVFTFNVDFPRSVIEVYSDINEH